MAEKDLVGDLINFRGIVYAPMNEQGVVFLFGKVIEDLNMYVELIRTGYPDCIARRFTGKGWEKVYIEFEHKSKAFLDHGHDPRDCDIIVCWEHDWKDCPIKVIELKEIIRDLPARPIKRPTPDEEFQEMTLEEHFRMRRTSEKTKEWYRMLEKRILAIDDSIWRKIAKYSVTFYSPERVFTYVVTQKSSILVQCFTGSTPISGVDNCWPESPKWGRCYLKRIENLDGVVSILRESHRRVCEALKNNENTGWWAKIEEKEEDNQNSQ